MTPFEFTALSAVGFALAAIALMFNGHRDEGWHLLTSAFSVAIVAIAAYIVLGDEN